MPHPIIVPTHSPRISASDRATVMALATRICAEQPKLADIAGFGDRVRLGFGTDRVALIGDNGEIPLLAARQRERLDYRFGYLAGEGDVIIIGGRSSTTFEAYQRDVLGLDRLTYLNVDPEETRPPRATPAICLSDPLHFEALMRCLDGAAAPTLMPHIATGTIWALAMRLAEALDRNVHVAGSPPRLSRLINDKGWFGRTAALLLGTDSVPPKHIAHGSAALTRHVIDLVRKRDYLFLKVPDSAGGAGNYLLPTAGLQELGARQLHAHLASFLGHAGWTGRYPLVVEVLDANVLSSPSVQTWIPASSDGPPQIEGVFSQVIAGRAGMFVGAAPADLPTELEATLVNEGFRLALLFQELGYYGRCSFDAVILGTGLNVARVHWIECNGRWGGVSIPLSLVNRLCAPGTASAFEIVQQDGLDGAPMPFSEALSLAGAIASPSRQGDRIVFLSPHGVEMGTGMHLLSCAATRAQAERQTEIAIRRICAGRATATDHVTNAQI